MTFSLASQQVSWWSTYQFALPRLQEAGDWPLIGSPAWCLLDDGDGARWASILDAAVHWSLRLETCQHAKIAAAEDISTAADWQAIAQAAKSGADFYIARPWLRRATEQ